MTVTIDLDKVAPFFARALRRRLHVPASFGGVVSLLAEDGSDRVTIVNEKGDTAVLRIDNGRPI